MGCNCSTVVCSDDDGGHYCRVVRNHDHERLVSRIDLAKPMSELEATGMSSCSLAIPLTEAPKEVPPPKYEAPGFASSLIRS